MNTARLIDIIRETTREFRKGPAVVERHAGGIDVTDVYLMPHVDDAPAELEMVDVTFVVVGVDKAKAAARKDELASLLRNYPKPERLAEGPSYIEMGAAIGSQDAALSLFALGQVMGLWKVITPEMFGLEGEEARRAAGQGFVMISGFKVAAH